MKNITYSDVLKMPTYERRFFIGQLTRDMEKRSEQKAKLKEQETSKNSKGTRTKKISGEALKNSFNKGDIPLN